MATTPIFDTVQLAKVASNSFNLTHDVKMSFNMGELIPITTVEVLPGDKFSVQTEHLLRFQALLSPVLHKVFVYTHYFFVPNRITWANFEKFIIGANDPDIPAAPYVSGTMPVGSLGDYLGLPTGVSIDKASALPFAAYQKIYNDYYRDQNLEDDLFPDGTALADGSNTYASKPWLYELRKRAWEKDYFTSALPWAQKGEPVNLPVGNFEDVIVEVAGDNGPAILQTPSGTPLTNAVNITTDAGAELEADGFGAVLNPNGSLVAKTSELESNSIDIEDLRTAIRLQEFLERNARGGTRYTEQVYTHFNTRTGDARLNRPEYIGGGKQSVAFSEVLQTSTGTETDPSPTGTMAGHGLSMGINKGFNYTATEHGYIIGIMSVMPTTAYQQGIPRHFSKFDPLDYAWPTFAHLGEQAILNRELYYDPANPTYNDNTFGYTPRYAEYKYLPNRVAGDFRSSLNFWHMGRIFADPPVLDADFIKSNPTTRVFAVEDENTDKMLAHVLNKIYVRRKLPIFGTPTI